MNAVTQRCPIRKILMSCMADYSNNHGMPKAKKGYYAFHITDINKIWYAATDSLSSVVTRFRNRQNTAQAVKDAWARGAKVDLWLLTQPERFDGEAFRETLSELDLLADRKPYTTEGPGTLYVIQHRLTHDYFVLADRVGTNKSTLLCQWLLRLQITSGDSRNEALAQFVTEQAEDILKGMNFEIIEIGQFENNEDLWLKRQVYIDDRKVGRNLNKKNVD